MRNYHFTAEKSRGTVSAVSGRLPQPSVSPILESPAEARQHELVAFLSSLMIFVKQCRAYPEEHPIIAGSAAGTIRLLSALLSRQEELTIGAAKRGLFIGKSAIEPHNRQFQLFASLLHEQGIATVTFSRGVTVDHITRFARLLQLQPSRVWETGGPEEFLARSGVSSIGVRRVSSELFRLTEGAETLPNYDEALDGSLWEAMIRSLAAEGFVSGPGGEIPDAAGLARLLSAGEGEDFPSASPPRSGSSSRPSLRSLRSTAPAHCRGSSGSCGSFPPASGSSFF